MPQLDKLIKVKTREKAIQKITFFKNWIISLKQLECKTSNTILKKS